MAARSTGAYARSSPEGQEDLTNMAIVYIVENTVNGFAYVGFTARTLARRASEHRYASRRPSRRHFLHSSMNTHGVEAFRFVSIAEGSIDEMLAFECELIHALGTRFPGGYNLTEGGDHTVYSDQSRQQMSQKAKLRAAKEDRTAQLREALRIRWSQSNARKEQAERGRHRSSASRQKQSESMKRRWADPDYRQRVLKSRQRARQS